MSDDLAQQSEQSAKKPEFGLGGQALIEGVMMRSPHFIGAAVRRSDGTIQTRVERFQSVTARHFWMRVPFFRGIFALIEMMMVGMRFLNWSAQLAMQDENDAKARITADSDAPENAENETVHENAA